MKKLTTVLCTLVLFAFTASVASAVDINVFEAFININGDITDIQAAMEAGGDDIGTYTVDILNSGDFFVGAYFDYEIDEAINTFFNETGSANNAPSAGQTWEIDEPGFGSNYLGDVYFNFTDSDEISGSLLDNTVFDGNQILEDVAVALGWDFTLNPGETTQVTFTVGFTPPNSGFYLEQFDRDSQTSIYFSSTLGGDVPPPPIPEPGTWILMLTGLALTGGIAAKRSKKGSK